MYSYLIVGAGLYGAVFANIMTKFGKKCLVVDKRNHIAGNLYCESNNGINVHKYGPHIFHTKNQKVWNFVNAFVDFNHFTYSPLASYKDKLYNLPFNMNTFYQLWGVKTPQEALAIIEKQRGMYSDIEPTNLEEQALKLVGKDIYNILIKGYTEKQWGRNATEVPAFIIQRIPLRLTYDNNYFNDPYQGVPIGGYNTLIAGLLKDVEVRLGVDYFQYRSQLEGIAETILFTGRIDEFYNFSLGKLDYRSLNFETEVLDVNNFQGNAGINYTESNIPYTRIVEHKHFEFGNQEGTVITKEYPAVFTGNNEPYYPVNDEFNNRLHNKYRELSQLDRKHIFGGRLGHYKYYNMDDIVEKAIEHANEIHMKKLELSNI